MTKIYNSFHDKNNNHYSFGNYQDFAAFWFSMSRRTAQIFFEESVFKKLHYAAAQSREARKPIQGGQ
jgi:hypothetical protein